MCIIARFICLVVLCANLLAQNPVEKVRAIRAAAEQGEPKGQYTLGMLYRFGIMVPQDDAAANTWLLKSAEQGNAEAQNAVGMMYDGGLGVEKD